MVKRNYVSVTAIDEKLEVQDFTRGKYSKWNEFDPLVKNCRF